MQPQLGQPVAAAPVPAPDHAVFGRHDAGVKAIAVSPDGRRLITGGSDCVGRVWDTETGAQIFVLAGHALKVSGVAVSECGTRFFTASKRDGTTRRWNAADGALKQIEHHILRLQTNMHPPAKGVKRMSDGSIFSSTIHHETPAGSFSVNVGDGGPGTAWILLLGEATGMVSRIITMQKIPYANANGKGKGHNGAITHFADFGLGDNGSGGKCRYILTAGVDGAVCVWNTTERIGEIPTDLVVPHAITALAAFGGDGAGRFAVGHSNGAVSIWKWPGVRRPRVVLAHDGPVTALVFSPDGARVFSGGRDGSVCACDATL